jgi:hypothetical protein
MLSCENTAESQTVEGAAYRSAVAYFIGNIQGAFTGGDAASVFAKRAKDLAQAPQARKFRIRVPDAPPQRHPLYRMISGGGIPAERPLSGTLPLPREGESPVVSA